MNTATSTNPFVGLRPFESDESLLFFGRQEQTIELLQRLHKFHFVGVVGSSGSGKSSLIRAGLIPRLKAGYLVSDRDQWLIPVCKPGEGPLHNFAAALLTELKKPNTPAAVEALVQKIQDEGADAIIELLQPLLTENRTNIFILVDQFEELFRFSPDKNSTAKKDEAIDFVNILLTLSGNRDLPVYVVITMRSDFIGDCSQFYGLPEALNQSLYLVPRLTRVQLKTAIEGPVRLFGSKINPSLTSRLLNDIQAVNDELPLLQHALMRTWDYEMKTDKNGELGLEDYTAVGGIEKALSKHADEALATLSGPEKNIAATLFQALTTTDNGGRKIRQPAYLDALVKVTGTSAETVNKLIQHFNADKRAFLVINQSDNNNPLIDISHESLIRQWETLNAWVEEETNSAKTYLRVSEAAALNKDGKKDLLAGTELQLALKWLADRKPNAAWASRYNKNFDEVINYLNKSTAQEEAEKNEKEAARQLALESEEQKKNLRRTKRVTFAVSILGLIALAAAGYSIWSGMALSKQYDIVKNQVIEINHQKEIAVTATEAAKQANTTLAKAFDSLKVIINAINPEDRAKLTVVTDQIQASIKPALGLLYQGGIIFYLDASGEHGLIAAQRDQGRMSWPDAAKSLDSLSVQGYTDWRLPTKDELQKLYDNKELVGGFSNNNYWTSTPTGDFMWNLKFANGYWYNNNKNRPDFAVRAIRKF